METFDSKQELASLTRASMLNIVRKYNLKHAIKGYSKLKKADLANMMWKHRHKWMRQKVRKQPKRVAKQKHKYVSY